MAHPLLFPLREMVPVISMRKHRAWFLNEFVSVSRGLFSLPVSAHLAEHVVQPPSFPPRALSQLRSRSPMEGVLPSLVLLVGETVELGLLFAEEDTMEKEYTAMPLYLSFAVGRLLFPANTRSHEVGLTLAQPGRIDHVTPTQQSFDS